MPDHQNGPYPLSHILRAELEAIRGDNAAHRPPLDALAGAFPGHAPFPRDDDKAGLQTELAYRSAVYDAAHKMNLSALCLSGGGIRSASFALGIIQAFAERNLLQKFDYLSTVSGGGYIGAWLSAWLRHNSLDEVLAGLKSQRTAPDRDPPAIRHLRQYSQYLTPRVGLMSGDTWAAITIILRNLLLNWLILVPAICFPVVVVKIIGAILHTARFVSWPSAAGVIVVIGCALLIALSIGYQFHRLYFYRPLRTGTDEQREYLWRCVVPAAIAGAGLAWLTNLRFGGADFWFGIAIAAAYVLTALAIRPVVTEMRRRRARRQGPRRPATQLLKHCARSVFAPKLPPRWSDILAWTIAGIVTGVLVRIGANLYTEIGGQVIPVDLPLEQHDNWSAVTAEAQALLLVFGMPWVLISIRFGQIFYILFRSYSPSSDFEREWLGRAGGWHLIGALAWIVVSGLVFLGSALYQYWPHPDWMALIGAVSGLAVRFLGKSGPPRDDGTGFDWKRMAANAGLAIAGPVFTSVLIILLSMLFDWIVVHGSFLYSEMFFARTPGEAYGLEWAGTVLVVAGLIATWLIADFFLNVNRFSLHALYRNRLIRAFLGAGRSDRRPDGFTGFDQKDNIRVGDLWPPPRGEWRPFHVINIALNLASSRELAWQQRKAMSFTVTPLHCGAADLGYRRTEQYGNPAGGISLGTAMAISGAAVSPNMGYHSSPSLAFLLTFFNVRLGWWLGNPGLAGNRAPRAAWSRRLMRLPSGGDPARPLEPFTQDAPPLSLRPILSELFGQTNQDSPYVYLSDGGHFENLGLYEMVRRRCKWIIVIDGGRDPDRGFADLGNAVRKIWIDLGVRISFAEAKLLRTDKDTKPLDVPYFAVGTIDYLSDPAGPDRKPPRGSLLYVKPTVRYDETDADIIAYKRENPLFPHQSTADQWFDEPQLEAYRTLGRYIVDRILSAATPGLGGPLAEFDDLFRYLMRVDPGTLARIRAGAAASGG